MRNRNLLKNLRNSRYWSQEHLAPVSVLSLRTSQRIEKHSNCSLESKKALAFVFDSDIESLGLTIAASRAFFLSYSHSNLGFAAAVLGLANAYLGITVAIFSDQMSLAGADIYYVGISTFTGICCVLIGAFSDRSETYKFGS